MESTENSTWLVIAKFFFFKDKKREKDSFKKYYYFLHFIISNPFSGEENKIVERYHYLSTVTHVRL